MKRTDPYKKFLEEGSQRFNFHTQEERKTPHGLGRDHVRNRGSEAGANLDAPSRGAKKNPSTILKELGFNEDSPAYDHDSVMRRLDQHNILEMGSDPTKGGCGPVRTLSREEIEREYAGRHGVEKVAEERHLEAYTRCLMRKAKYFVDFDPFIKSMCLSMRFYCWPAQVSGPQREKLEELIGRAENEHTSSNQSK